MGMGEHSTRIEVDLKVFRENIRIIRSQIGDSLYCLPVKARAYGHGLERMAKEAENAGVDYLATANVLEGAALRKAGISIPILVLGVVDEYSIQTALDNELEINLCSFEQVEKLEPILGPKKVLVHLKVETGMQRLGISLEKAREFFDKVNGSSKFLVKGVFSHLATADLPEHPFAEEQIRRFRDLISQSPFKGESLIFHLANSGGVVLYPDSHLSMVRPGLATYGYLPKGAESRFSGVKPCFTLKSHISFAKDVPENTGVGYGQTYITPRSCRILTLPIGYGDGFLRALSNKGSALIGGKRYPIAGNVCMDQLMIDAGESAIGLGEEAVLIGKQEGAENSLEHVSELAGTIPYEVLCLLNDRIPRRYLT